MGMLEHRRWTADNVARDRTTTRYGCCTRLLRLTVYCSRHVLLLLMMIDERSDLVFRTCEVVVVLLLNIGRILSNKFGENWIVLSGNLDFFERFQDFRFFLPLDW